MRKPASREMISASVELCETEVCFLHVQLFGTNVRLPKMHRIPPDVDFESSRSPACSVSHMTMYEIKRAKRLSQDFVHFVTARGSLFTNY